VTGFADLTCFIFYDWFTAGCTATHRRALLELRVTRVRVVRVKSLYKRRLGHSS